MCKILKRNNYIGERGVLELSKNFVLLPKSLKIFKINLGYFK